MTPQRARKAAATKLGLTLAEYDARRAAGERWCTGHQGWHPAGEFRDKGSYCVAARSLKNRRNTERRWRQEWNDRLARLLVK